MLIIKRILQTGLLLLALIVVVINAKLYYTPQCVGGMNQDVLNQLNHLEKELKDNQTAQNMQNIFPEGFVFSNVLYGLAWADVLEKADKQSDGFKKGCAEIRWSIEQINSEQGKSTFDADLGLPYGAFYNGWLTYLQGKYLQIKNPIDLDTTIDNQFKINCLAIQKAIEKTDLPYLESYSQAAWPADNILCLASLDLHDKMYPPQYQTTKYTWLNSIKAHLDPEMDLIPHAYNLAENKGSERVLGSSQSLMLCFLPALDAPFAQEQFQKYKQYFVDYKLTLPAIREYPNGKKGDEHIDSGPVIWDVGAVASIVGIKAMLENKDSALYKPIRNCIEAFGFSYTFNNQKQYLFGQLFVADAFIAWSNAKACSFEDDKAGWWRWRFHLLSFLIVVPFCWWVFRL